MAVSVTNTIRCALQLNKLELLWKLKLDNDEELSNICLYETGVENPSKYSKTMFQCQLRISQL